MDSHQEKAIEKILGMIGHGINTADAQILIRAVMQDGETEPPKHNEHE